MESTLTKMSEFEPDKVTIIHDKIDGYRDKYVIGSKADVVKFFISTVCSSGSVRVRLTPIGEESNLFKGWGI